ncbi:LLM class flavin-dependent oxidoreductase [Streptomyces sp. NPDC051956]|uniref:LLM class flavin-dependent oxidoreductase n=1 Tax=Streptomyces sp. NPDC051956 TaxID=3365677 RepID=UPI0037CE0315
MSCQFATSLRSPERVATAEQLGYHRAWLHETPAQGPDVWAMLAPAAERTHRIGLAPGVLVRRCAIQWSTPPAPPPSPLSHPAEWPSPSVPVSAVRGLSAQPWPLVLLSTYVRTVRGPGVRQVAFIHIDFTHRRVFGRADELVHGQRARRGTHPDARAVAAAG